MCFLWYVIALFSTTTPYGYNVKVCVHITCIFY